MLRSFLLNWFASQYGDEIRARVQQAAAEAVRGSAGSTAETFGMADIGFLFTAGKEYGYFLDLLKEVRAVKGNGLKFTEGRYKDLKIAIVETGNGSESVREGTLALLQVYKPYRVISAGFASALKSEIKRSKLFIPLDLISEEGEHLDLRQKLLFAEPSEAAEEKSLGERTGPGDQTDPLDRFFAAKILLTVSKIPADPRERGELAEKYGADIADSASFFVASVCREASVPFLPVRVSAHLFDEEQGADVRNITDSEKESPARLLGAFLGAVSRRPSSFLDLCKVKEREITAADTLAEGLSSLLDAEIQSRRRE